MHVWKNNTDGQSLPLEGKAAIREYHLLKKGGEAATRALNLEP